MTQQPNPTVSVIISTYNRENILPRAIKSVLAQTFDDFELFVVDDASTDDTESVVEAFEDSRINYIKHEENTGSGGIARNTALKQATGRFVAFLDDDDVWLPTKLEKQVSVLEESDHRVGLVYCWMEYRDGSSVVKRRTPAIEGDVFEQMLDKNAITAASTLLVRKSAINDIGAFDPDLPRGIDSDFIRRVSERYEVRYVPEVLVEYNVGHEFDRDSAWDETGIRKSIVGAKRKFDKFPDAFDRFPKKKASNLAYIGAQYFLLGSLITSVKYFARALKTAPSTWKIYFHMGRIVKFYIDRYVPIIGRIIDRFHKG